mmetsp:Transcript_78879/g.189344  ORF Transcript_78879/g.189344 Transcript_78879/m.189344 type:complete len:134 (+) Transcript_78879:228-629(+)
MLDLSHAEASVSCRWIAHRMSDDHNARASDVNAWRHGGASEADGGRQLSRIDWSDRIWSSCNSGVAWRSAWRSWCPLPTLSSSSLPYMKYEYAYGTKQDAQQEDTTESSTKDQAHRSSGACLLLGRVLAGRRK